MVELSVVVLIVAVLASIMFSFLSRFNRNVAPKLSSRLFLQMEGRRLADTIAYEIRGCTDIVRPLPGESLPFLLVKDARNHIRFFYLSHDVKLSGDLKMTLYELLKYNYGYTATENSSKSLGSYVSRISFSGVSANSVQCNVVVANDKNSFQFLSHVGLMSIGDSDV